MEEGGGPGAGEGAGGGWGGNSGGSWTTGQWTPHIALTYHTLNTGLSPCSSPTMRCYMDGHIHITI